MSLSRDAEYPAKTGIWHKSSWARFVYNKKDCSTANSTTKVHPNQISKYFSPPNHSKCRANLSMIHWGLPRGCCVAMSHPFVFLWELIGYCYFKIFSCSTLALSKIIMLLVIFRLVSQCFMFISVSHHLWSFQSIFHSSLIITWSHCDLR